MNCPKCNREMLPTPSGYFTCDTCDVGLIQGFEFGPGCSEWKDAMKRHGFKNAQKESPGSAATRFDSAMKELAEIQAHQQEPKP